MLTCLVRSFVAIAILVVGLAEATTASAARPERPGRPSKPGHPERPGKPSRPTPGSTSFAGTYSGELANGKTKVFNRAVCPAPSQLGITGLASERTLRGKTIVSFAISFTGGDTVSTKGTKKSNTSFETKATLKAGANSKEHKVKVTGITSSSATLQYVTTTKKGKQKNCQVTYTIPLTRE